MPSNHGNVPGVRGVDRSGDVGLQPVLLAGTPVFVLPNPSGRNAHYSYGDMLAAFRELKRYVDGVAATSLADTGEDDVEDDVADDDTH